MFIILRFIRINSQNFDWGFDINDRFKQSDWSRIVELLHLEMLINVILMKMLIFDENC